MSDAHKSVRAGWDAGAEMLLSMAMTALSRESGLPSEALIARVRQLALRQITSDDQMPGLDAFLRALVVPFQTRDAADLLQTLTQRDKTLAEDLAVVTPVAAEIGDEDVPI